MNMIVSKKNKSSTYSQSSKLLEKIIQITFKIVFYQTGMMGSVRIRSIKYLTLDSLKMLKVFFVIISVSQLNFLPYNHYTTGHTPKKIKWSQL